MKKIVLSGVNIVSGGMLSVYKDCIRELLAFREDIEIVALVHDTALFADLEDARLSLIAFPRAKKAWLFRVFYEYIYFYFVSRKLRPDVWMSMHDMTPNVTAKRQFLYCHNAAPFYKMQWREAGDDITFTLFVLFYKYLYKIGIGKNDGVIVQQEWMREAFRAMYGVGNVIVARPHGTMAKDMPSIVSETCETRSHMLFYPVTSHTYKNVEVLCRAARCLPQDAEVSLVFTMDGTENAYARSVVARYKDVRGVHFIGRKSREEVFSLYGESEAMLFPSRLESWGMPLSEYMQTGKPILVADLPYAHEVVDGYDKAVFLPATDERAWADAIASLLRGELQFHVLPARVPAAPYARNWKELFAVLGI